MRATVPNPADTTPRSPSPTQVFAARRLDDPNPESWQMPQGGIDPGETPEEAAVRVSATASHLLLCIKDAASTHQSNNRQAALQTC
jgi:ADP-ribose pyrophosphatase YjhB (NUDIX family)